jgi:uncharacterized paraquat-inducible protein A
MTTPKVVGLDQLGNAFEAYHEELMRQFKAGKLVPINKCPSCGGLVTSKSFTPEQGAICPYCRTKFKIKFQEDKE